MSEKIENMSVDHLFEKGIKFGTESDYDDATKHLKKAAELDSEHKKLFYNLGSEYEKLKETIEQVNKLI